MLRRGILTAVIAGLALAAAAPARACPGDGLSPAELSPKQARESVLCLINQRRDDAGVPLLNEDHRLERAAQRHSSSMDSRNFFSHSSPGGGSPLSRVRGAGYLSGAASWGVAENIRWGRAGRGSPKVAVAKWMASPSHRSSMLSGSYRHVGVGVAIGSPAGRGERNAAIYTVDFGYRY
jgi:uncharacterized protein YkwD